MATPASADGEPVDAADRVEELLRGNDGTLRQREIVRETGWSPPKVSYVLRDMLEADRLDRISLGRENIVSLPGEGPSVDWDRDWSHA